ncbi:hypothetical protein GCM10022251_50400 [Phytohabitans flavus]|uniref:Uncharacterized protein n=1 Tax=Phytohabitans flavus TaxID=1076124 RepID=A0A6F8XSG2_9ACTN|nr:hypothetical protein [Phytohabitans flavus]BCB76688.1 hypothetical protein Pflav_030980 [Phytohabitans flavus]
MAWTRAKWRAVLLDLLERAGWSAGQVFVATLLAGGATATATAGSLPWKYALTLALSAAVSSVILTLIQYASHTTKLSFWPDLLVRLGKTFLATLAASIAAANVFNIMTFDWNAALNLAFLATLTALGKGLLARENVAAQPGAAPAPAQSSPSTLPTATYTEATRA